MFRYPIPASTQGTTSSNFPSIVPLTELKGPWEVTFDPMWGGPKHVVFDDLIDWTQRLEDSIRYYSGTAVYRKTFNLTSSAAEHNVLLLNLGEIHEEAVVKLNGIDVGVVWTKPARIDVTRAARLGQNDLEISVTNLWPNRLIGDDALPPSKRLTRTNIHKFSATTPLYPSGLDGPVILETGYSIKLYGISAVKHGFYIAPIVPAEPSRAGYNTDSNRTIPPVQCSWPPAK